MSRAENIEARQTIEQAAFELFREVGYSATSYSAIAARCDMTRALVQYYFKKKEDFALILFTRLLESSVEALGYSGSDSPEDERGAELYRIGQLFFLFLIREDGYRSFLLDVLSSRELTESVLAFNAEWALEYLGRGGERASDEVLDSVIMTMGGFYELLYHCLKSGRQIDIARGLYNVMFSFMASLGHEATTIEALLRPAALQKPEAQGLMEKLRTRRRG